jgi:hypothetical protein
VRSQDLFGAALAPGEEDFARQVRALGGRLLAWGAGESGAVRVAVPRTVPEAPPAGGPGSGRDRGEVVVLEGTASGLAVASRSPAFPGRVADLARTDVDGDGRPEVLFAVGGGDGPREGRGRLVLWEVPQDAAGPPGGGKIFLDSPAHLLLPMASE